MRRGSILLAVSMLAFGPIPIGAATAQVIEDHRFCSDTAANIVFYLDVTTPYDATDRDALVSGVSQIFDNLQDGARLSIRTIEDSFSSSDRLLDMCVPYCPSAGFFNDLFSSCTEGVVINEKKKLRAGIRLAIAHRLDTATELPNSEIIRTISSSASEEYRAGRENRFYIFSDMIENSPYLTGKAFFSTAIPTLLLRLKSDNLVPDLSGASVRVFGFGRTGVTGVRAPLPQDKMKKITSFWTGYFEAAKATLSLQQNLGAGE